MKLACCASSCDGSFYIDPSSGKVTIVNTVPGAWSTTNNVVCAQCGHMATGTQNAGLIAFGCCTSNTVRTQEYNGTTWSISANAVTPGQPSGCFYRTGGAGTQNATIAASSQYSTNTSGGTNIYNGSTWSDSGALGIYNIVVGSATNQCRHCGGGVNMAGTTNSTLLIGSDFGFIPIATATYEYNGNSWAYTTTSPYSTRPGQAGGTQNAASVIGPFTAYTAFTQCYNGSSWSVGSRMNFPRGCTYGNSGNSSNDLYVAGGINGSSASCDTTVTERYNGTTWSMGPSLNANRNMHGMAGSSNAGLVSSGKSGFSIVSTSEELTGTGTSCVINTLSPS